MARAGLALIGALFAAACGAPPPPGPPLAGAAVEAPRAAAPAAAGGAPARPSLPTPQAATLPPPLAFPAGALYACAAEAGGEPHLDPIELAPEVRALCAGNPEMGPCRYARQACRSGGGRVYAADGQEITRATEAEYDRRVLRLRLQSN